MTYDTAGNQEICKDAARKANSHPLWCQTGRKSGVACDVRCLEARANNSPEGVCGAAGLILRKLISNKGLQDLIGVRKLRTVFRRCAT
jgi:hypothetical protein